MPRWMDLLNNMIAGKAEDPPVFIETLRFPPPVRFEDGRVVTEWTVDPAVFHPGGAVFGGYLAALADYVLGPPAWPFLGDDDEITTSNLQISFFRPVTGGSLHIESRVVNRSRRVIHVEASFTRDDGKLAAIASATQMIVPTRGPDGDMG